MAAVYLPAPIKVENNYRDTKPNYTIYLLWSVALGILSYYAPKIFLGVSVVNFAHQVYCFNRSVQTGNFMPHEIHKWTITACLVTWSIGTVFVFKSLPFFWSAIQCTGLKEIRHLHLIPTIVHFAKGFFMLAVAGGLSSFHRTARDLASQRQWVEMEDYVTNYPAKVKQTIMSSYWRQMKFYIAAFLPESTLAKQLSRDDFSLSQFQSVENKLSILRNYFNSSCTEEKMRHWPLAIHQFQQLPIEAQKLLGDVLHSEFQHLNKGNSKDEYLPFPADVHALLFEM
ncbi:MAG TPA: hypothetical protein VFU89_06460 [Rhabdochlamydiaceae bacterium]|nr:hypothetical protein [Rhabdochlamydiaceae bacterium]